jgi:hypothetical protein
MLIKKSFMKDRRKIAIISLIFILVFCIIFLWQNECLAGTLTEVSALMWYPNGHLINTPSTAIDSISVYFTPESPILTNYGIKTNFQSDFDIARITGNEDAVVISQLHSISNMVKGEVVVNGQDLLVIVAAQSDNPTGSAVVNVVGHNVTTPSTYGEFNIAVSIWDLGTDNDWGGVGLDADILIDSGTGIVDIGPRGQVQITADVEPSLSFNLSANSCDLVTLSKSGLQTCSYTTRVSTNASSGYNAAIKEDGDLRNATNSITNVSDGTVGVTNSSGVSTEEEYGVSTSKTGRDILHNDSGVTCINLANQLTAAMPATALTTSDQSFSGSVAPIENDVTTLCHAAVIKGITPAGSYSQQVTITIVGNF